MSTGILRKDIIKKYQPKTRDELKGLVTKLIKERGTDADLNDIDVSEMTDMSYVFYNSKFNGDISNWDVGKGTDTRGMFNDCPLEANPPKWFK